MRRLIAVALLGLGCASPGMPPGGPPDVAAPQIVAITPDSGTLGVKPGEVVFQFDEVVSERPPSVTTLGDLFLISPRNGVPNASWHRDAIGVRPSQGWRANTAYTVIMLRGLADIRGNVRNTGASTFFSTGNTIPHTRIAGNVFDWVSGSPANGALVESFVPPDSIHAYVALADSNGAFVIEHLPPARYTVRAYVDRNKNQGIDPSEPWDSVSITLADTARRDLVIFTHDTAPPRIREVRAPDSLTLQVTFDKPVDPTQTLTAANFAVIAPDSARIPIGSAGPPPKDTAVRINPAAGVPPSAVRIPPAPHRDTTVAARPVMRRPLPITEAVIKLQRPLTPKLTYRVRALGIRGLLGHTGDSERTYTVPAPPPPAPPAKPVTNPPAVPPPLDR
ncbi:MAG TPA: Ig-like domain-containing protein [Gemmatimonadaceae bacterium]|nr:Ig-like domain-containing protein [Gemmatimonadaceae bacterium]